MSVVIREVLMVAFIGLMAIYLLALRNNNVLLMEQVSNLQKVNFEQQQYIEELQANDSKNLMVSHIMEQGATSKQAKAIIKNAEEYQVSPKY